MSNIVISNATPIISILKVAKDKKIINKIRPIVEQMVQRGRWYSKNVIDKFLGDVGE